MRKALNLVLCAALAVSITGCGSKQTGETAGVASATKTESGKVTVEQLTSEAKQVDMTDEEAWKKEPAYGTTLKYFTGDGCTAAVNVAEELGYYKENGLTVEGFKGESDVEAIGTGQVQIAIGHVAKSIVPATNGVNLCFVGGAHLLKGCKAIYVLADSPYQNYEDLKGKSISVPSGIGAADYNITARLLLESGINPIKEAKLTVVEKDACVPAMQKGELDAALLGESFGYKLVQNGTLRKLDSKDGNSRDELCCTIMMNKEFVQENPITAAKMSSAVKKALKWMGDNPEECTKLLMKIGLNGDDYDMNLELNKLMEFGQEDEYTTQQMQSIIEDYIKTDLITATDDANGVMTSIWNPIGTAE